jgi:hypothetical protein
VTSQFLLPEQLEDYFWDSWSFLQRLSIKWNIRPLISSITILLNQWTCAIENCFMEKYTLKFSIRHCHFSQCCWHLLHEGTSFKRKLWWLYWPFIPLWINKKLEKNKQSLLAMFYLLLKLFDKVLVIFSLFLNSLVENMNVHQWSLMKRFFKALGSHFQQYSKETTLE